MGLGKTVYSNDNSFSSIYISEESTIIRLFNPELKNYISSMEVDFNEVEISDEYFFSEQGKHRVKVILKEELNSTEKLFKGCTNLT